MKFIICFLFLSSLLTSCIDRTELGDCIGLIEEEDPNLKYRLSVNNMVWSILGIELIFPPVLWASNYAKCPTGIRR